MKKGLAAYDENTKELLKPVTGSDHYSSDESDWNGSNESNEYEGENVSMNSNENNLDQSLMDFSNFECNVCPDFFTSLFDGTFQPNQPQPQPKINLPNKKSNATNQKDASKPKQINTGAGLRYIAKVPNVIWQQSDEIIVLTISATDNLAYNLQVTNNHLIYR